MGYDPRIAKSGALLKQLSSSSIGFTLQRHTYLFSRIIQNGPLWKVTEKYNHT